MSAKPRFQSPSPDPSAWLGLPGVQSGGTLPACPARVTLTPPEAALRAGEHAAIPGPERPSSPTEQCCSRLLLQALPLGPGSEPLTLSPQPVARLPPRGGSWGTRRPEDPGP